MARRLFAPVGIVTLGAALVTAAFAQTPVRPQPTDPHMPAPHNTLPDKIQGGAGDPAASTGTLSDKLEKTDGVIKPPPMPGRVITPPETGTMPIIPPAGTPGSKAPNAEPR